MHKLNSPARYGCAGLLGAGEAPVVRVVGYATFGCCWVMQ